MQIENLKKKQAELEQQLTVHLQRPSAVLQNRLKNLIRVILFLRVIRSYALYLIPLLS